MSMLTRLIQRSQSVAEDAFEYEYEKHPENRNSQNQRKHASWIGFPVRFAQLSHLPTA
ncbi:MAG: hypothetical protein NXI32_21495 [bacterium]|nr:hypothetical protein [bacterium]